MIQSEGTRSPTTIAHSYFLVVLSLSVMLYKNCWKVAEQSPVLHLFSVISRLFVWNVWWNWHHCFGTKKSCVLCLHGPFKSFKLFTSFAIVIDGSTGTSCQEHRFHPVNSTSLPTSNYLGRCCVSLCTEMLQLEFVDWACLIKEN